MYLFWLPLIFFHLLSNCTLYLLGTLSAPGTAFNDLAIFPARSFCFYLAHLGKLCLGQASALLGFLTRAERPQGFDFSYDNPSVGFRCTHTPQEFTPPSDTKSGTPPTALSEISSPLPAFLIRLNTKKSRRPFQAAG